MRHLLIALLLALIAAPAFAQPGALQDTTRGVRYGFLPAASFSSDLGLLGGGAWNRTDYRGEIYPFRSMTQAAAAVSTKAFFIVGFSIDQTRTFNTDIRSRFELIANRILDNNYFGEGNDSAFDRDDWEDGVYLMETFSFRFQYRGRLPLYNPRLQRNGGPEILLLAGAGYQLPRSRGDNTVFVTNPPVGRRGHWINYVGSGLHWEKRDNEFRPTRGFLIDWAVELAPKALASTHNTANSVMDLRLYTSFHLIKQITFASRFRWQQTFGERPYWGRAWIGDQRTLRGYPIGRFRGDASLLYNLELRTWLFELPQYNVKLGGQIFSDFGRVFDKRDRDIRVFSDYKYNFGIGGAVSVFHEDFIIRADLGISDELSRINMGLGYMF